MARTVWISFMVGMLAGCRTPQPTPTPVPVEPPAIEIPAVEQAPVEQAPVEQAPDPYDEALDHADDLLGQAEFEQALASFSSAAQLRPDELLPRSGIAVSLLELGRLDEAEDALVELQAAARANGDEDLLGVIMHNLDELAGRRRGAPPPGPCKAKLSKTRAKLRHYSSYLAAWKAVATGDILDYVDIEPEDDDEAKEQICAECAVGEPRVFKIGDSTELAELHVALPTATGVALVPHLGSIMGGRCTPEHVAVHLDADTDPKILQVAIYETSNWEDESPFPVWDPNRRHGSGCYVEEGRRTDLFIDIASRRIVAKATREDPSESDPAESITLERDGDRITLSGCGPAQQVRL